MTRTLIDSSCRIPLPQRTARQIGSRPLELVSSGEDHLLFTVQTGEGEMVLAGRLGEMAMADLLSFFNMFRKTGILRFALSGGAKRVYFDKGEIVYADSTFPEDDFGDVLLSQDKIDRKTLQKARRFVSDSLSLGAVLAEKKLVEGKDLWLAARQQVEEIVYDLFGWHEGGFSFLKASVDRGAVFRLSLNTQNLIMEGLRRVDERALFMRRIPGLDAVVVPGASLDSAASDDERKMASLVAQKRGSVRDLLRWAALGEFEGLRLLYQLAEKKAVAFEEPPSVDVGGELGELLSVFNGLLTTLHRQVAPHQPTFRREVQVFLRDLPQPFSYVFRDVTLREDGAIDGARILGNLSGLEEGDKKKLLADALGELIFMECHLARRELGTAGSADLLQRVQEVSRRVKTLVGRKE